MAWRAIYTIGKLLERKCLKWTFIAHLDMWNTSYGLKKGQELNYECCNPNLELTTKAKGL